MIWIKWISFQLLYSFTALGLRNFETAICMFYIRKYMNMKVCYVMYEVIKQLHLVNK